MASRLARFLLLAPLLLVGCNVVLTAFSVPTQVTAGTVMTVTIAGNISGTTGYAGCVLQLPIGWAIEGMTNNQSWRVSRDDPSLLAAYTAEPGYYLAAYYSTGTGGIGGAHYLSQITLRIAVAVPANAVGQYTMKVSLAGGGGPGAWQIQEPAGVAQFASITAVPYARSIVVAPAPAVDFVPDGNGLPPDPPTIPWSGVALGDVDGDGRDDLAAASAVTGVGTGIRCWLSRLGTTWVESSSGLPTTVNNARVAFADFDGDGFLDLVDSTGRVCFGNGGTSWVQTSLPVSGSLGTSGRGLAVGDVDGDGLPDIAISSAVVNVLVVLLNNGNRTFRDASAGLPASTSTGDTGNNLILADLDGDGDLDLLWAHTNTPNVWLGDGQGRWTPGSSVPSQLHAAAVGDLDGDGAPEVVISDNQGLRAYRGSAIGSWVQLPFFISGNYQAIALVDFDRDGRLDVVAGHANADGGIDVWRNVPGGFALEPSSGLPNFVVGTIEELAVGDFDGNTFPDLAIAMSSGVFQAGINSLRALQNHRTGVSPFGGGCAGTALAEPQLFALGLPQRGNAAFAMQVQTPATGSLALFWFGGSRTFAPPFALPLDVGPFGAPTCTLWASLDYTYFGLVDGGGNYTVALPVPADPALAFRTAFSQGGVFAPSANPFGMVFTRALALRVE